MAKQTRTRVKGRTEVGRFIAIPHSVLYHSDYQALTGAAVKLLLAMLTQYNGHNNGDLTLALSVMRNFGFNSSDTLNTAKQQLLNRGLIVETRAGRFTNPGGICSLYAVTWRPIDDCGGKLDLAPTQAPLRSFSLETQQQASKRSAASDIRTDPLRKSDRQDK